jgi:hypothetical protein
MSYHEGCGIVETQTIRQDDVELEICSHCGETIREVL